MVGVEVSGSPMSRRKWKLALTAVPVPLLPASVPVPYRSSSAVVENVNANAQVEMEVLDTRDVVLDYMEVLDILPPIPFPPSSVGIILHIVEEKRNAAFPIHNPSEIIDQGAINIPVSMAQVLSIT